MKARLHEVFIVPHFTVRLNPAVLPQYFTIQYFTNPYSVVVQKQRSTHVISKLLDKSPYITYMFQQPVS